jgi:hypothetical protein
MSQGKRRKRQRDREFRVNLMRDLYSQYPVEVLEFSPIHYRVIGTCCIVDYWPSTGRAWIVGSSSTAAVMEPKEVFELVAIGIIPEDSKQHILSL